MRAGVVVFVVAALAAAPPALAARAGEAAPNFDFWAAEGETNDVIAVDLGEVIYAVDLTPNVVTPDQCERVWRKGRKMLNEVKCDMGSNRGHADLKDGDDRVKLVGFDHGGASGGPGNDRLYGGGGDDELRGDDGNDRIYGRGSNSEFGWEDKLDGGPGDDVIDSRGGRRIRDLVLCGDGVDTVKADPRDRVGKTCERVFRSKRR
jgi:Ca2+-binding RTX toxin-like protein